MNVLDPPFRPIFHSCSSLASPRRPPGTRWVIVVRAWPARQDFLSGSASLRPALSPPRLSTSSPSLAHCSLHPPPTPFLSPCHPGGHPHTKIYAPRKQRLCPQKFLGPCCKIPQAVTVLHLTHRSWMPGAPSLLALPLASLGMHPSASTTWQCLTPSH